MLLDSNILIACLAGDANVKGFVLSSRVQRVSLFISVITIAELTSLSSLTNTDLVRILSFADEFPVLQVDRGIAETAGQLRRTYRLALPDALIAATALVRGFPLVTRDKKLLRLKGIDVRSL